MLVAKGVLVVVLQAEAVRWPADEFPGRVEVQFTDAAGRRWSLVDKGPIFDAPDDLGPESAYPLEVGVVCVIRETMTAAEDEIVTVSTSVHGVTALSEEEDANLDAVAAGLTLPWNSGVVEGHVNRIKMLKRQMFGRAGFELLRKRVLLA
ncbi:hypothetical protein [Streptomyces sp. NBC_01750]|uniref:hypothetical protein n=1 Tax=Streptomyces sp. NBC_01750 TaxID=2975928 RepID=UPI002DD9AEA3|nr:hypothetical protein [Streptomyces sp. NBC_01750]WSD38054.1 hypothetical protein OG966_00900 [Streptomyces sp. NBC_01750]